MPGSRELRNFGVQAKTKRLRLLTPSGHSLDHGIQKAGVEKRCAFHTGRPYSGAGTDRKAVVNEREMPHVQLKGHALLALRILLTVIAWVALITYSHHLGHKYIGGIKEIFESPISQLGAQVVLLSALIYLITLSLPVLPNPRVRGLSILIFWMFLLVLGHQLSHQGLHELQDVLTSSGYEIGLLALAMSGIAYLLILSLPFVPGVELGLLIMVLFGRDGVIAAYLATIGGLCLAYAAAWSLPKEITSRWMSRLGLSDAAEDPGAAINGMVANAKVTGKLAGRFGSFLLNHRHLTLAACLNLPGNSVLGGGGGIAFLCGLSGQFHWRRFILTIVLATAPIPILVLFGLVSLEPLLERHGIVHDLLRFVEGFFIHDQN